MTILAFDTATEILCASLKTKAGRFEWSLDCGLHHAELLMDVLDRLCGQAEVTTANLNGIVCCRGPGSFTGLRIGMASAKGLSEALGLPLVSVSTLDAIAQRHLHWPGPVLVLIDARKNRFYAGLYLHGHRVAAYLDQDLAGLLQVLEQSATSLPGAVLVSGPHAGLFQERLIALPASNESKSHISLVFDQTCRKGWGLELLDLGQKRLESGNWDPIDLGPEYVRASDAELNITRS